MNEDWLNKIRDRMADYEIDEPDGLWTAIENRRQAPASGHGRPGRNVILAWVRRSAAAAVLAAVGLLCFYVMKDAGNFAEPPSSPVVAERVCPPAGVETPAQVAATSGKTCAVGKPGCGASAKSVKPVLKAWPPRQSSATVCKRGAGNKRTLCP